MTRNVLWLAIGIGALVLVFGLASWSIDLMDLTFLGFIMVGGLLVILVGALFDIWQRADLSGISRIVWSAAILIFPLIGTLIYVVARPPAGQVTYKGEQPT